MPARIVGVLGQSVFWAMLNHAVPSAMLSVWMRKRLGFPQSQQLRTTVLPWKIRADMLRSEMLPKSKSGMSPEDAKTLS